MNTIETASREGILKFKLACKSSDLTDGQIDELFLDLDVEKEEEIDEILAILLQYRKNVYDKYVEETE